MDDEKMSDLQQKFGVNIPIPTIKLSSRHPCSGCIWYARDTNVLFCPFHSCVRIKKALNHRKIGVIKMVIKRGDIFYADLNPVIGSEQGGVRPVLIVQNDVGNRHSPTVIVVPISSAEKSKLPVYIKIRGSGLPKDSTILAEQIRTLDRCRIGRYVGSLDSEIMRNIDKIIKISLGVNGNE